MIMTQDKTSLYQGDKCLTFHGKGIHYGLYRIMWQGKRGRIIIYTNLPGDDFLKDGDNLELRYYESGRMDNPNEGIAIYQFKNIQLNRQWIAKPSPIEYEYQPISKFSEYYCDIIEVLT